jgi:SAM-dependent methyltransferase
MGKAEDGEPRRRVAKSCTVLVRQAQYRSVETRTLVAEPSDLCPSEPHICREKLPGLGAGNVEALRQRYPGRVFERAISVGGGFAPLETLLVQADIVEHFDLYETADSQIEQGRVMAARRGLADRLVYHKADAFAAAPPNAYDLVNWFGSLHHMLDVVQTLTWSRDVLAGDGVLLVDEFVGPTRMQYTER